MGLGAIEIEVPGARASSDGGGNRGSESEIERRFGIGAGVRGGG